MIMMKIFILSNLMAIYSIEGHASGAQIVNHWILDAVCRVTLAEELG